MNERIRELKKQATRTAMWPGDPDAGELDAEKFAKLIVQECLMKAIGAKIRGESIDILIQNIKEDFGVEE